MQIVQLRVVFDSNIYVAAALRPGQYADRWLDVAMLPSSGLELFVSPDIIAEIQSKLTERFSLKEADVRQFLYRISISAKVVSPSVRINAVPNDKDDNAILECALEARAHLIITADTDLLTLNPYKNIGIAHPKELKNIFARDYLKHIDKNHPD